MTHIRSPPAANVVEMIEDNPALLAAHLSPDALSAKMPLDRSELMDVLGREPRILLESNASLIDRNWDVLCCAARGNASSVQQVRQ